MIRCLDIDKCRWFAWSNICHNDVHGNVYTFQALCSQAIVENFVDPLNTE